MSKVIILLAGFLFIASGIGTGVYQTIINSEQMKKENLMQKIKEGEEYLKHTDSRSIEKAVGIFTELSAKVGEKGEHSFQVIYNLAVALEKKKERTLALDKFKQLNQMKDITREQSELLDYSYGKLLLKLNQDAEGMSHLEGVLRSTNDAKLRSNVLTAIADYYYQKKQFEKAKKNYILALQEDAGNVDARIGWGRSLRVQGKDWASYEVFDEYLAHNAYLDPDKEKEVKESYRDSVYARGIDMFRKKRYTEAVTFLKKSAEMNPGTDIEEKSFYYIAESYDAMGNSHETVKYLNEVLNNTDYSMDSMALYKKGTIYFRQKKYDRATAIFQEVMDKYPGTTAGLKAESWKKESLDQLKENTVVEDKYDESNVDDTVY